jgi:hypothetical protein
LHCAREGKPRSFFFEKNPYAREGLGLVLLEDLCDTLIILPSLCKLPQTSAFVEVLYNSQVAIREKLKGKSFK